MAGFTSNNDAQPNARIGGHARGVPASKISCSPVSTYICGCPWAPMGFCGSSGRSTRLPQSEPERDFRPKPTKAEGEGFEPSRGHFYRLSRPAYSDYYSRRCGRSCAHHAGRGRIGRLKLPQHTVGRRGPSQRDGDSAAFRFAGESDRSMHPSTEQRDSFQAPSVVSPKSCRPLRVTSGRSTGADRKAHHPTSRRGVIASELA